MSGLQQGGSSKRKLETGDVAQEQTTHATQSAKRSRVPETETPVDTTPGGTLVSQPTGVAAACAASSSPSAPSLKPASPSTPCATASSSSASSRSKLSIRPDVHFDLHPVDREYDVVQLFSTAKKNQEWASSDQYKPLLLYASQMFGAGKTTLGRHALVLLNEDLKRFNDGKSPQGVVSRLLASGWKLEEVQSYADAHPVFVSLDCGVPESVTLKRALHTLIWKAALQDTRPAPEIAVEIHGFMVQDIVHELCKRTGKERLYVFIDEVGVIEESLVNVASSTVYQDLNVNPTTGQHPDWIRVLLIIARELLKTGKVFMYIAGKCIGMTNAALQLMTSPCVLKLLPLGPLSAADIERVLQLTDVPVIGQGQPTMKLSKALQTTRGLAENLISTFAARVQHWTGGVPRAVQWCMIYALQCAVDLSSKQGIENALQLDGPIFSAMQNRPDIFSTPFVNRNAAQFGELRAVFQLVFALQLHNIPFRFSSQVLGRPLLDWISQLCLHVKHHRPSAAMLSDPGIEADYEVVLSPYALQFLTTAGGVELDPHLLSVAYVLRQLSPTTAFSILSQGRTLEILTAQVLLLRLLFTSTPRSLLADVVLGRSELLRNYYLGDRLQLTGGLEPRLVPSFYTKHNMPKDKQGYNTETDWPTFCDTLQPGAVSLPDTATSAGPDLVLLLRLNTSHPIIVHGAPLHEVLLQFATKNHQGKDGATFSTIRDEINKCLMPFSQQIHSKDQSKRSVLFIVATQYSGDLATLLAAGSLRCAPGSYQCEATQSGYREGRQPKLVPLQQDGEKARKAGSACFDVPEGTELVIVSPDDLRAWLGARTLADLQTAFGPKPNATAPATPTDVNAALRLIYMAAGTEAQRNAMQLPPFELERFLRDEAKIKPENVAKYLPLLKKNEVDEEALQLLTDTNFDKILGPCGVLPGDQAKILEAAKRRAASSPSQPRKK